MTSRVQTYRSSVAGARPGSGPPGQLYLNFAERQLGYLDPAAQPVDLLAVRKFHAGSAYLTGDCVLQDGHLWVAPADVAAGAFDPADWTSLTSGAVVADTPPPSPVDGALWLDDPAGIPALHIWSETAEAWLDPSAGKLPLAGGTVADLAITGALDLASHASLPTLRFNATATGLRVLPAGTAIDLMIAGAVAGTLPAAGSDAPDAVTLMTRQRGDARYLPQTGGVMTGELTVEDARLRVTGDPGTTDHAVALEYVDGTPPALHVLALDDFDTPATAQILQPAAPVLAGHLANKGYVDAALAAVQVGLTTATADARYLRLIGGTLTGPLSLFSTRVDYTNGTVSLRSEADFSQTPYQFTVSGRDATNTYVPAVMKALGDPSDDNHLTPKRYVDTQVTNATTQTQVLTRVAGGAVGAVGTYALARNTTATTVVPGTVYSGANLLYAGMEGGTVVTTAGALPGSWRAMGGGVGAGTGQVTLYLRIS